MPFRRTAKVGRKVGVKAASFYYGFFSKNPAQELRNKHIFRFQTLQYFCYEHFYLSFITIIFLSFIKSCLAACSLGTRALETDRQTDRQTDR